MVAIDIETKDPNLKTLGDGSCRNDGRVLCAGVYGEVNGERVERVFDFDSQEEKAAFAGLLKSKEPKVFHNGVYDLAWLACGEGMEVNGTLHDTMTRMVFIDEYADLGLDDCCKRFSIPGKNKDETIETWYDDWQESMKHAAKGLKKEHVYLDLDGRTCVTGDDGVDYYPSEREMELLVTGEWKKDVFGNVDIVWNDPEGRRLMKTYNLQDCKATYSLFWAQEPLMKPYEKPYQVECDLYYLLIKMKKAGVRIDPAAMDELTGTIEQDLDRLLKVLDGTYGVTLEMLGSSKQLGERLNKMGIHSPVRSAKTGAESWSAEAKARLMHYPVMPLIVEAQGYQKLLSTYMHGGLRDAVHNGRIHCTFSPNKREEGGTVTGRFSCSKPNLQQVPAREKQLGHSYGQAMRAMFLPEEGCMMAAMDYSQIEYLLLAHFAKGPQAEWFRGQALDGVDFHKVAMTATGIPSRTVVKTFNYGVIYGMGWQTAMYKNYVLFEKLASEQNLDIETFTKNTYNDYHAKLPVIRDTMGWCQNVAKAQGYITTLGGRREHKPKPVYDPEKQRINDYMYKMLNKLIQGTAADILKNALHKALLAGVFDVLTMHLTVHDENVTSVPFNKTGTEAARELQDIMESSYKEELLVPMAVAAEVGPNWGYWSGDIWEEMQKGNFDLEFFNKNWRETA